MEDSLWHNPVKKFLPLTHDYFHLNDVSTRLPNNDL